MSRTLRLAFAGTPEFAVPALAALARSAHRVAVVYTQPDRPAGRGRRLTPGAVKEAAQRLGIPIEQPASLEDESARARLADHAVDAMVVVAYGLILPQSILDTPPAGCINIHASLLPRWRGAAPIQRAILAGDAETGISIMQMEAGLDTGPVYLRRALGIAPQENAAELQARLAASGAECIVEALDAIAAGRARPEPQDAAAATYARKLEKSEATVDWSQPATHIARAVRAFNPWPIAQTRWNGEQLRIWRARRVPRSDGAQPGAVIEAGSSGMVVACGEDALAIEILQLPGKRPAAVQEFLKAHDPRGAVLGRP